MAKTETDTKITFNAEDVDAMKKIVDRHTELCVSLRELNAILPTDLLARPRVVRCSPAISLAGERCGTISLKNIPVRLIIQMINHELDGLDIEANRYNLILPYRPTPPQGLLPSVIAQGETS